jgi:hypothetical protein
MPTEIEKKKVGTTINTVGGEAVYNHTEVEDRIDIIGGERWQ